METLSEKQSPEDQQQKRTEKNKMHYKTSENRNPSKRLQILRLSSTNFTWSIVQYFDPFVKDIKLF